MFDIWKESLVVLGGLGGVKRRIDIKKIKALVVVGSAEEMSAPITCVHRLGRYKQGHRRRTRKFIYLPSLLIYEMEFEPLYRGVNRLNYENYAYSFNVIGKNREAFLSVIHSTECPIYIDGSLVEGNPMMQQLYQDGHISSRVLPLMRDKASIFQQKRYIN